jgi:hypothetical protein
MVRDRSEPQRLFVSIKRLFIFALSGWTIAVLAALVSRTVLLNAHISGTEYAAWLFLGCAPVAIALFFVRGPQAQSVTQVLYEAERAGSAGRTGR